MNPGAGWFSVLSTTVLILILFVITACSSPQSSAVRFGLASAPISLDPRFATDATSSRINRLLYQRLVDFDEQFQAIPSLADWQRLSNTVYRFHLRDHGRRFENGELLSSADVKATYEFILDPANASPHRGALINIDRIDVIDNDSIDFYLKKADPLFPSNLVIGIVPASVIKQGGILNTRSVGSGQFKFVDWINQDRLTIERRKDQQRIEFIHVQDATVRVLKLMRGEIDMLQNDLPRELVHYLEKRGSVRVEHLAGNNFSYLGFNQEDPALKDIRVRQAIAHAVDRESLIQFLLGGRTVAANSILAPDHWAGLKSAQGYEYDPSRARELLKQAGYHDGHPLQLEYKTSSDPFRIRIATIIQQQLSRVGITVSLRSFDWATFYGDIKSGRFQMYSLSWVGIKNPNIFRYVFHSQSIPPKGANRGHYNNQLIDQLIEKAESAENFDQRADYYRQIQQTLLEDLPYVPLWYEEHFIASNANISGYQLVKDGNYDGLASVVNAIGEQDRRLAHAEVLSTPF
jgi:peptide/nickel transport system substrate-binding protein